MTVYFDYHATTPCDPKVVEAMLPFFATKFANPSSATHTDGIGAAAAVAFARSQVADLIDAEPGEIVFTASATESNNLAILGLAEAAPANRRTILTTAIEHKSVLGSVQELERRGFDVKVLPVDPRGHVELDQFETALARGSTFLVSIQGANNEVGTIQDIPHLAELAHRHGAVVHSDAVQAVGRIPVSVDQWGVDLLSLSAHKLYGPKGAAALYIRGGHRAIRLRPLMYGGDQENGLRPGTLNVPAIVGFGEASDLSRNLLPTEQMRIVKLRDQFEQHIAAKLSNVSWNGDPTQRLPGNSSVTIENVDADALIVRSPELALSMSSACISGVIEPSHVLLAIGLPKAMAYQTLRIGLGRFTTETEVDVAANRIIEAASEIRALHRA